MMIFFDKPNIFINLLELSITEDLSLRLLDFGFIVDCHAYARNDYLKSGAMTVKLKLAMAIFFTKPKT